MKYIILGAGKAGKSIARDLLYRNKDVKLVLVDDDDSIIGSRCLGVEIQGPIQEYITQCQEPHSTPIIIAFPSADKKIIAKVYSQLKEKNFLDIKILPSLTSSLRDAKTDLLENIDLNELLLRNKLESIGTEKLTNLKNKTVLITGAGGSIGEILAEHILLTEPRHLLILDNNEPALVTVYKKLKNITNTQGTSQKITPLLLPVEQKNHVDELFINHSIDYVFHTAAYKHVDMVEMNAKMGVLINIIGTRNLLEAAANNNCSQFIHISTDKVVEPSNIYGYSKLVAELLVRAYNSPGMNTVVTRFGNVLGSSGSVIPIFIRQIARGGPLTITDLRCKRYFMTIPEACSLILHASFLASKKNTHRLFVLEMGQQVSIVEIARRLCKLCGLELHKDILVQETGLREGEKLEERLFFEKEIKHKSGIEHVWEVESIPQRQITESISGLMNEIESLTKGTTYITRDRFYTLFESHLSGVV